MRSPSSLRVLIVAAGIAALVGCSGGPHSGVVPAPSSPQAFDAEGLIRYAVVGSSHLKGFYACPATGPIKYVSDENNDVIYIYTGRLAGQAPCGEISVVIPVGLYVKDSTHDLYVTNRDGNIFVFHRGQMSPYNTYTEPTDQSPQDVTVAGDGTVIASNGGGPGSLSTWIGGPSGGTYVGNFLMKHSLGGGSVAVNEKGIIYYDDLDVRTNSGAVWSVSCPAGACGAETRVPVSQQLAFGLAFDSTGDLLLNDARAGTADTFELPNRTPTTFRLGSYPCALAVNRLDHHWFVADPADKVAAEYDYPSGTLIGTIQYKGDEGVGNGIAVDP